MQSVPKELHPMAGTYARAVSEELNSMRRTQYGKLVEEGLPWEGRHSGTGEKCEKSFL